MGRIDSNQNSFNYNTNQSNPPQAPQDHQYPYQQPPTYVAPDTIDIVPPPPYDTLTTDDNDSNIQQQQFHHQPPRPPPRPPQSNPMHPTHHETSPSATFPIPPTQSLPYPPPPPPPQPSPIHPTHQETSQPIMFQIPPPQPFPYPPPPRQPSPMHPTHEVLSQPVIYPPQPPAHQTAVPFPPPSPQMAMARATTFPQATNRQSFQSKASTSMDMPTQNAYTIVAPITNGWRSGLLDCMVDPESAIQTLLCPFVTFGQIAEIVDEGATSCGTNGLLFLVIAPTGMPWLLTCMYRAKLRKRYGIAESPAADWAVHLFCGLCGLCQEYRELKARGIDPSVGWHGNMGSTSQKGQQQVTMTPPANQTMMG